jgi:MtrB/PioB family decaheme-associated outer membrane protein
MALMLPPLAAAQTATRGTLELGLAGVDLDHRNAKYGEYTGIADDDAFWIGRLDLGLRQEARYLDLHAADLGLQSRAARLGAGEDGRYSFGIEHVEIPHLLATGARSPYDGIGGTRLRLPDDFVPASTTSAMGGLAQNLDGFDLKNERDINRFHASAYFGRDWLASLSFRREDKTGVDALGGVVGENGGRVASVILPRPIDYRTDELRVSLAYDHGGRQLELGYLLSEFRNGDAALVWDVPYVRDPIGLFDYPSVARTGLEPDNRYERLSLSGGFNFLETARLSAHLEAGEMRQNEALLPYSTDDIGGTAAAREDSGALPRATARAAVDVLHLNLDLSANPLPRLALAARYRLHRIDNRMPYTLFDRVVDDTAPQSATVEDDIYSRPYDWRKSQTELSASYGFENGLHLRTRWRHDAVNYDPYHEVPDTREDTLSLRLRKQLADWVSGSVGLSRARRRADDYDAFRSYSSYFTGACPNLVTVTDPDTGLAREIDTCFVNHPDVRKYMMASRRQRKADLALDFTPHEAVDVGLSLSRTRDRYDDRPRFDGTYLGLRRADGSMATLDVGISPDDVWSLHAYFTRERYGSRQNGRAFVIDPVTAVDSGLDWRADFDDGIDTLGAGGRLSLLEDRLVLALDCAYAWETSEVKFATGAGLAAAEDLPEDRARRYSVSLDGTYEVRQTLHFRLGVEYERYRTLSWSTGGIEAGGVAIDQVLPLYGPQPGYDAWLFTTSVVYDWR